jgi:hypothetical protein
MFDKMGLNGIIYVGVVPALALREVNRVFSQPNNAIHAPGVVRPASRRTSMSKTYEEWIDHYETFYKRLNYDLGDVLTEIGMIRDNPGMGRDRRDAALCVLDWMETKLRDATDAHAEPMRVAGPAALFR